MVIGADIRRFTDDREVADSVLQALPDGVVAVDAQGRVLLVNHAAARLLALSEERLAHARVEQVLEAIGDESAARVRQAVDVTLHAAAHPRDGSARSITAGTDRGQMLEIRLAALADGGGVVMLLHDMTDRLGAQQELHFRATHDHLTGLMNGVEFQVRVHERLDHARASGSPHALCFVDLDHFKAVNDTCGHPAGDRMLRELCQWLRRHVRKNDILARLGGDEFGLLLDNCREDDALAIAQELLRAVQRFRFEADGRTFRIGASIGIVAVEPGAAFETLMHAADAACYTAKQKGRNRIEVNRFLAAAGVVQQ